MTNSMLVQFAYLQLLDMLTTLAFLMSGVAEGNPLVNFAISATASPLWGLLLIKSAALMLGFVCWRRGKQALLGRANVFFAGLVTWNVVALIVSQAGA